MRSSHSTRCRPTWSGRPATMVASATRSSAWMEAASSPNSGKSTRDTRSVKMSMIPPQVSPTAKASPSETPNRVSTGG